MPEPNKTPSAPEKKDTPPKKTCNHTVGDKNCTVCVNKGDCPSGKITLEEIADVESGRDYCVGKS